MRDELSSGTLQSHRSHNMFAIIEMELDEAHYQIAFALQEGMKSGEPNE